MSLPLTNQPSYWISFLINHFFHLIMIIPLQNLYTILSAKSHNPFSYEPLLTKPKSSQTLSFLLNHILHSTQSFKPSILIIILLVRWTHCLYILNYQDFNLERDAVSFRTYLRLKSPPPSLPPFLSTPKRKINICLRLGECRSQQSFPRSYTTGVRRRRNALKAQKMHHKQSQWRSKAHTLKHINTLARLIEGPLAEVPRILMDCFVSLVIVLYCLYILNGKTIYENQANLLLELGQ